MARVRIRALAEAEITEATEWYRTRSHQAARFFVASVDATIARIAVAPEWFPEVAPQLRRAIVPHFPYGVFFVVTEQTVSVVGVIHARRDPKQWMERG